MNIGEWLPASVKRMLGIAIVAQLPTVGIMADATNDSLFNLYVQHRLNASLPGYQEPSEKAETRSGKEILTGLDLKLYEKLVPLIQAVAAGTLTNTVLEVPAAEIVDCGPFSGEDLGVAAITNKASFDAAVSKLQEKLAFTTRSIVSALLADYPYDFYWFDKTTSYSIAGPQHLDGGIDYYWDNESGENKLTVEGNFKANFAVAKEYSATDEKGTYTLTADVSRVGTAITNAQNIANSHASKTPLARLDAYRQEICDLVEYNHDALENNPPYGNPWQLIWVFDNDESTKVVCEGYSKAFKYLCDLSGFTNIECILADGDMDGGTGAGPHMWNVIRMDDNRNYLIDVTNCDGNSVGNPDKLFMAYNPTGSYASGYVLSFENAGQTFNISYTYSNDCKNLFGEQALTLSSLPYQEPQQAEVALSDDQTDVAQLFEGYEAGDEVHITYERKEMAATKPVTICLPFDYTLPGESIGTFWVYSGVTVSEGKWEVTMNEFTGSKLTANTPYIFKPVSADVDFSGDYIIPDAVSAGTSAKGDWTLKGTYEKKTWDAPSNDYGFVAENGTDLAGNPVTAGTFVRCGAGAWIAPLRCYLTYSGTAGTRGESLPDRIGVRFVSRGDDGGTTGISDLPARMTGDGDWFDLSGRRLGGKPAAKGVYIHNGRKTIIK